MSFMDKVKSGFDKAKEGISDLAETTRIKHDISLLNDRKAKLFGEIGRQMHALRGQGREVADVEALCQEIDALDVQIKQKADEIARINAEPRP
jgi:hypothetical protein